MTRLYQSRHLIYAVLAGVLVLDAVVYFGLLGQVRGPAGQTPAQLAPLEEELKWRRDEVKRLERIPAQLPAAKPALARFAEERFFSARGFSHVAEALEDAAAEAGVTQSGVNFKTEADKAQTDLVRVAISAQIEGDFGGLVRFVHTLERSPRFYLIRSLSLDRAEQGEVRLDMELLTYFRRTAG